MRVSVVSDLNLSLLSHDVSKNLLSLMDNREECDLLVIAGNLANCQGKEFNMAVKHFSNKYPQIVYTPGMKDFGSLSIEDSKKKIRSVISRYNNFHFIDSSSYHYKKNTAFIGSTLWTDFDSNNPQTKSAIKNMIPEYRYLKHEGKLIKPDTILELHYKEKNEMYSLFERRREKFFACFVTSTAPSFRAIDKSKLAGNFASDLEHEINIKKNLKLWIHGSSSNSMIYNIHQCTTVTNPIRITNEGRTVYEPMVIEI